MYTPSSVALFSVSPHALNLNSCTCSCVTAWICKKTHSKIKELTSQFMCKHHNHQYVFYKIVRVIVNRHALHAQTCFAFILLSVLWAYFNHPIWIYFLIWNYLFWQWRKEIFNIVICWHMARCSHSIKTNINN